MPNPDFVRASPLPKIHQIVPAVGTETRYVNRKPVMGEEVRNLDWVVVDRRKRPLGISSSSLVNLRVSSRILWLQYSRRSEQESQLFFGR